MPLPPPRLLLGGGCCDMLLLLLGAGLVRAAAELGSEAEPRLACRIRQRLHAAVVPEAAAVKADLHARHTQSCQLAQHTSGVAERWCARTRAGLPAGRLLAARPRSLPPARARAVELLPDLGVERGGGRQRVARAVVNHLQQRQPPASRV